MLSSATGLLGPQTVGVIIGLAIITPILLLRNSRPRKLRVELLWVRPAIWALIAAASFSRAPPPVSMLSAAILIASSAVGGFLGWHRGKLMRIEVDPDTHQMTLRASPAAMLFIVVLMVLRMSVRNVVLQDSGASGLPISVVIDGLILFSLGLMLAQAVELWIRGRRLLDEARAAKPAGQAA
jgi:hypothetical protein